MENVSPVSTTKTESSAVASLYNKLFNFEGQLQSEAYPIHKKLDFGDTQYTDIYDWLITNQHVPHNARILDAGCGVGFGSQLLASATNSDVCGISLSENEIRFARSSLPINLTQKLQFHRRSFDDIQDQELDCIVAVESLKHSENLPASLTTLMNSLKPGGTLLLVEDILSEPLVTRRDTRVAKLLCEDWHLKALYSQQDYQSFTHPHKLESFDLTAWVRKTALPFIYLKTALFRCLHRINPKNELWKIYRGGFLLDAFYARNQMRYQLLKITKVPESPGSNPNAESPKREIKKQ